MNGYLLRHKVTWKDPLDEATILSLQGDLVEDQSLWFAADYAQAVEVMACLRCGASGSMRRARVLALCADDFHGLGRLVASDADRGPRHLWTRHHEWKHHEAERLPLIRRLEARGLRSVTIKQEEWLPVLQGWLTAGLLDYDPQQVLNVKAQLGVES